MSRCLAIVVAALAAVLTIVTGGATPGIDHFDRARAQQAEPGWFSTTIWRPTLVEAGEALAEILNQIDALCSVAVDPVVATNGTATEGPVYAFTIAWTCPEVAAEEQPASTWLSNMVWRPTLEEVGGALAEVVNQIDASCIVDIAPVVASGGAGSEGPVYAFAVSWACPTAASGSATWGSTVIWRPTLEDAGVAVAELVNQIGASCPVDIDPVVATNGAGPEGPVYAFTVSWSCAGTDASSALLPAQAAVVARDIAFEPSQLNVPANTELTLTVTNEDPTPHNFSIDALQFSEDILPGATASISGNLAPGTYVFYCNVPGHRDLGMKGTIIAE